MGKPYGDCKNLDLDYYDESETYTMSRCLRQCETKFIEKICHCKEPFMPGFYDAFIPTVPNQNIKFNSLSLCSM